MIRPALQQARRKAYPAPPDLGGFRYSVRTEKTRFRRTEVSEVSKKSALARKREAQEAKRRRKSRLIAIGIGAAVVVLVVAIAVVMYFAVRSEGPKVAEAGDVLSVYYTLWLEDGTQVESNVGGNPFKFTLGAGDVIKGWDQGLVGMKVGETRTLTIPPDLAYVEAGSPPKIPPNATLTFEVELLAVE